MRTKYILHIGDENREITSESIQNWDEIKCAYSRKDFNGIVRSFSSQFEFVGEAYDMLFELYLSKGIKAEAILSVLTITDRWEWVEQFRAPLDFSTISWDGMVLSIAAVDNGLAALISANKSTKYEFLVGSDIVSDYSLEYDRLKMINSVVHELMSNVDEEYGDGSISLGYSQDYKRAMVYTVGDAETYENSPVSFADQTSEEGSYFIKIEKASENIELNIEIDFDERKTLSAIIRNAGIYLVRFTENSPGNETIANIFTYSENSAIPTTRTCLGCFASLDALKKAHPNPAQDVYAVIGPSYNYSDVEAVYFTPVTNDPTKIEWIQGTKTALSGGHRGDSAIVYCRNHRYINSFDLSGDPVGSMFALYYKTNITVENYLVPLLDAQIGLKSKIRTSWISRAKPITIDAIRPINVAQSLVNKMCDGQLDVKVHIDDADPRIDKTYIFAAESIRGISNAKFYSSFNELCDWMQTVFGYTYYLGELVKNSNSGLDRQDVYFVHRDSLFDDSNVHPIEFVREVSYSVDNSAIYSAIEVGYEKKDYNAECGRDEWNFTSVFSTGITVSDKTLTLKSKYRADCYGFEFLAQKRAKESKDDKADNDVFFVHCSVVEREAREDEDSTDTSYVQMLVIDRSVPISGTLSNSVFNGEYAPHKCLLANESYIAKMSSVVELKFSSSDGNSDVIIDEVPANSDITLHSNSYTLGQVSFTTGDVDMPKDINALIRFNDKGITYSGYLLSVEYKYARNESAKYKLIVKDVTQ